MFSVCFPCVFRVFSACFVYLRTISRTKGRGELSMHFVNIDRGARNSEGSELSEIAGMRVPLQFHHLFPIRKIHMSICNISS